MDSSRAARMLSSLIKAYNNKDKHSQSVVAGQVYQELYMRNPKETNIDIEFRTVKALLMKYL